MAHINNGNLFNCSGIASAGNYCHSPPEHSCFHPPQPSAPQTNAWNAILRKQPESRNLNQGTAPEVTLRSSHSIKIEVVSFLPKKVYPPLGHYAVDVYTLCPEKAAVLQLLIHFLLCSRRGKKNPAFKNGFSKFIYRKKFYCSYSRAKQASHSNPNGWVTFFCH